MVTTATGMERLNIGGDGDSEANPLEACNSQGAASEAEEEGSAGNGTTEQSTIAQQKAGNGVFGRDGRTKLGKTLREENNRACKFVKFHSSANNCIEETACRNTLKRL